MMSMLRNLASGSKPLPLDVAAAVKLHYTISRARHHMDATTPQSFVFIHDTLQSNAAWGPLLNGILTLPMRDLSPVVPLDMYAVDCRNHGLSPRTEEHSFEAQAADVLRLITDTVEWNQQVHIVGAGPSGGRVALLAALAAPDHVASVAAIDALPSAMPAQGTALLDAAARAADEARDVHKVVVDGQQRVPPPASTVEAALRKTIPRETERLGLMELFDGRVSAEHPAGQWKFNDSALRPYLTAEQPWPASASAANKIQFPKPATFISTSAAQAAVPNAELFPQGKLLTMAGAKPPAIAEAILGQAQILGTVNPQ